MPRRCPMPSRRSWFHCSSARSGAITGAWLAGAATLALLAGLPAPAVAAEPKAAAKIFERSCAGCHSERRVARKVKAMPAADREARLRRFMADHHAPDATERELLIRYMMALAAR